ncbi:MAG: Ribonuclease 3 [Parcubacteria group bacterium GW2011_GWE2_39_37]|uniref:Ribonuclease 3 n=1 Tax=Candidatus Falkowbacteria bacterium GW2011_GWF2_39_8 TaxID=1618642 RepID=A0A0G0PW33_9BACT|nr:MAG: Ribonuclease 3 [Parcubacteria group bacterium GW2011_GWE2_39_37]KKR32098.1 MAG: Ribonuclease 3 [Candidatus Falkowbacteria bacterium GW2011_GWF2_39_8]
MKEIAEFEKVIDTTFKDKSLLRQSVVHRSYLNEHPDFDVHHNERLEFLGDAVLEIVVTEYLFNQFPETPEGDLTNWRASLVNAKMLALVAKELSIEKFLYLSKGEAKDKNSKARQYILANAIEAIIGAIYLDQGIEAAKKFIEERIIFRLKDILDNKLYLDPKSKFQEKAQEIQKLTPHYKILNETGPDHDKIFEVGVYLGDEYIAKGKGSSKQEAQVDAAAKGLKKMKW